MASEVNPSSLCLYPVLGWGSDTCALDSMSGGMECHCSCEEQLLILLAVGIGKVEKSTLGMDSGQEGL